MQPPVQIDTIKRRWRSLSKAQQKNFRLGLMIVVGMAFFAFAPLLILGVLTAVFVSAFPDTGFSQAILRYILQVLNTVSKQPDTPTSPLKTERKNLIKQLDRTGQKGNELPTEREDHVRSRFLSHEEFMARFERNDDHDAAIDVEAAKREFKEELDRLKKEIDGEL